MFKCSGTANILIRLMVFRNDGGDESAKRRKKSITKKFCEWIRRNAKSEIEFLDIDDKDTNEYLNEAEYNARLHRDYIRTKMSENEYKLLSITENLDAQRIEQMKKINDIDLSVAKNEKQLADINNIFGELNRRVGNLEEEIKSNANLKKK